MQTRGYRQIYHLSGCKLNSNSLAHLLSDLTPHSAAELDPRELSAYQLICLAARFSQSVYSKPTGKERETHVDADWRMGTKAMVIKSIPIDHMNVVVFAIRGSQTFMDWAVNLNSAPAPPQDFLVRALMDLVKQIYRRRSMRKEGVATWIRDHA